MVGRGAVKRRRKSLLEARERFWQNDLEKLKSVINRKEFINYSQILVTNAFLTLRIKAFKLDPAQQKKNICVMLLSGGHRRGYLEPCLRQQVSL